MPSSTVIPAGQTGHTFYVEIRDQAFLSVGAYFNVTITSVQLSAAGKWKLICHWHHGELYLLKNEDFHVILVNCTLLQFPAIWIQCNIMLLLKFYLAIIIYILCFAFYRSSNWWSV